jgi:hypothetical protein
LKARLRWRGWPAARVGRVVRFGGRHGWLAFGVPSSEGGTGGRFGGGLAAAVSCVRSWMFRHSAPWRCGDVEIRRFGVEFELHPVDRAFPGRFRPLGGICRTQRFRPGLRAGGRMAWASARGKWQAGFHLDFTLIKFRLDEYGASLRQRIALLTALRHCGRRDNPRFGAGCARGITFG